MANFISMREVLNMKPWFDHDSLTRFVISYVTRDHTHGTSTKEFPQIRNWILDNLKGDVVFSTNRNTKGIGTEHLLYLSLEEDIIMFKLSKWYDAGLNRR